MNQTVTWIALNSITKRGLTHYWGNLYMATSSCPSRARETIVPSGLTITVHP